MAVANSIDSLHKNVYVSHELGDFHRSQIIEMTDFVQTMTFTGLNKKKTVRVYGICNKFSRNLI